VTAHVLALALAVSTFAGQSVGILFHSDPDPPRVGLNKFQVLVSDSAGKRVEDAAVQLQISRTTEPHMRRTIGLKHYGDGLYRGTGEMTRPGEWSVVAVVRRGGEVIGTRTLSVTVK
jgi:nitrogen fixation protein FixH